MVYGSDRETADSLRKFIGGELLVDAFPDIFQLPVLPATESEGGEEDPCSSSNLTNQLCFRAGDNRVNENQGARNYRRYFKIVLLRNWN